MKTSSATGAHRPWLMMIFLVGLVIGLFVAPFAGVADATTDIDEDEIPRVAVTDAVPDLVITFGSSAASQENFDELMADVSAIDGVAWATGDLLGDPGSLVVSLSDSAESGALRNIERLIAEHPDGADIGLAGRVIADREIANRIGTGVFLAVALAAIAIATLIAWLLGIVRGVISGLVLAVGTWLGGTLGASAAGSFDGALVTTSVPAVLSALAVSGYLIVRLLVFFDDPEGDDQADMIRRSVRSLAVELIFLFASLAVVVVFLELVGPGRSAATVVFVAALTSALFTLAVLPAVLAGLVGSDAPWAAISTASMRERFSWLPVPSGSDFPLAVLIGFGAFLALLGLFAFRVTDGSGLLDERALDENGAVVAGTRDLLANGGDPTSALLAEFDSGTAQLAKVSWLERVSALPSVGRVDTPTGRYVGGAFTPVEGLVGAPEAALVDDEAPRFALVVPTVTGRSPGGIELVEAIRANNAPVNAELSGVPADARTADQRDRSLLWLTMISLSIVAGIAAFALVGDFGLAGLTSALRLLELMAVTGVFQLLIGDVSGAEIQIALLITSIGATLFELGFLKRVMARHRFEETEPLLESALHIEGAAAAMALGLCLVAGIGFIVPDLAVLRRFGIALAVSVVIEMVLAIWLLRPALLGTRAITHFAAQPVQAALRALSTSGDALPGQQQGWVDVVGELLWTEFNFQADPAGASIDSVFVSDTPLHRKAVEHHASLADAGLRIIGRTPQLRKLRVVGGPSPATVAVTVDHPARQLIDAEGKVVGVRRAERRSVMLWLTLDPTNGYRIADSVELGAQQLGITDEAVASSTVASAALD